MMVLLVEFYKIFVFLTKLNKMEFSVLLFVKLCENHIPTFQTG